MTLLSGSEVSVRGAPWLVRAHAAFCDELLDPGYPCYFGSQAEREGFLRYTTATEDDLEPLRDDLTAFVELSRANPRHRHVLVVFFDHTQDESFDASAGRFWRTLQWLHDHDPEPWPANIPSDPDEAEWEFCFNDDPMFAFPVIPAYRLRRSRGPGSYFALCFQPRRIFAGVNRDDPGGEPIRRHIYERVRAWDAVPPHPVLEPMAYGDRDMREWRQYVLPDANSELPASCPLRIGAHSGRGR